MKLKQSLLFPFFLLCLSGCLYAQSWSGIIDPARAIDWTSAGVVGGIPTRTTICATETSSSTYSQINTDIQNCPLGQVVYLNPGTYNLTSGLVMKGGVTLRGAGADQTLLVFTGYNACYGLDSVICTHGSNNISVSSSQVAPGGTNSATWSGGYSQGATQITLTGVGNSDISVGDFIYLDQANDSADNGNFFVCDNTTAPGSVQGGGGSTGRVVSGVDRSQTQIVQVTNVSGSTYTISPGLYAPNWRSSQSPGAWWAGGVIQDVGIENLSVDNTNSGELAGITFNNAANCWVQGVRSIHANRNHVWFVTSAHITVQNNYFYGTINNSSESYGVESFISSDNLIVNNIFHQVTAPILMNPGEGLVLAYNFAVNDTYDKSPTYLAPSFFDHNAGVLYNLFEGNNGPGFEADIIHGTSGFNTLFRNRLTGWETGTTQGTVSVYLYSYNRYENVIGNVLGEPGYTVNYQTSHGVGTRGSIYDLGAGNPRLGCGAQRSPGCLDLDALGELRYGERGGAVELLGGAERSQSLQQCGSRQPYASRIFLPFSKAELVASDQSLAPHRS